MTVSLILFVSLSLSSTAFTYRHSHPAALFPYQRAAVEHSAAGPHLSPAFLPGSAPLFLDMSYSRPYGLEGLHAGYVSAGAAAPRAGALVSWRSFGIEEYREDTVEAAAGFMPWGPLKIGGGISYDRLRIDTDAADITLELWDVRAAVALTPFPWIDIAYQQENLRSLISRDGRDLHFPEWCAGIALRPVRGFAAAWNINGTYFGPVNTVTVSANIMPFLAVTGGWSRETHSLAGAVILLFKGTMVSYGLRYHGYLGPTHSLSVTVLSVTPPLEEIRYAAPRRRAACDVKLDLETCTIDELRNVGIDGHVAERLVKYRQSFGPLSRLALIQMGVLPAEFSRLKPCLENIAPDPEREQSRKKHRPVRGADAKRKAFLPFYTRRARKALFQELVNGGVKAGSALRVAELAKEMTREKLSEKIGGLAYLNESEKKAARKICASR